MTDMPQIRFAPLDAAPRGTAVALAGQDMQLGTAAKTMDKGAEGLLSRAARIARFTGARKTCLELLAPERLGLERILVVGRGAESASEQDWLELGGYILGQLSGRRVSQAGVLAEAAGELAPQNAAALAAGALLRAYRFRKFKTKPAKDGEAGNGASVSEIIIHCGEPEAAGRHFERLKAVVAGVHLARDLVNEPANTLGPVEFAAAAEGLAGLGVEVEVLDVARMEELGMKSLLSVGQGSSRPSRLVVMHWNGAEKRKGKPVCFVGKGVVFDTGGISMKPAKGMEDMKGDMAGAACVTGLMSALARRKAAVHAVGIIGLVENMPSGTAMRPGDIIGSMSGQTIEVLNTDAEGRLVLADAVTYAQRELRASRSGKKEAARIEPRAIIDLATLTGAIMVALGKEHAGLFSNDDRLAGWLREAGEATGERVWRMPMDTAYDKELDSKNADMKNIGGQYGGAITAAHFIKRFIGEVPWAHLDIAGVAMASNRTEINESWGSGWGVRLLDRLVAEHFES